MESLWDSNQVSARSGSTASRSGPILQDYKSAPDALTGVSLQNEAPNPGARELWQIASPASGRTGRTTIHSRQMQGSHIRPKPNWIAILIFYVLACAFSWPFFWWRDVHTASWTSFPLPPEIKDLTWGPAVAALLVFWMIPATREWAVSFFGPSWLRSTGFFLAPILFGFIGYRIHSGVFSYRLVYYLLIGGVSTLGEELGWRGFLQGSLRPLGRVRGYLLVALMWEAWHFTSHLKGTRSEVLIRLSILIPLVVTATFLLGFVVERTDSLLLAVTLHEWLDVSVESSGTYLMWAALACIPIWSWLIWQWPERKNAHTPALANGAHKEQFIITPE
jgi:uncharacterized protein